MRLRHLLLVVLTAAVAAPAGAQPTAANLDTVRAGRFDGGRMFTVDEPPLDYLRETYNFAPDQAWFDRARLGSLRFATYCSASFVSEDGLILTNHHCARESVTQASVADGVDYNEIGFYAEDMEDERLIDELFVEQLIGIADVTAEISAAGDAVADNAARQQAIQAAIQATEQRLTAEAGEGNRVQVVTLYAGGQYKAYTYRRYDHIKLVFAPETQAGYFGGDPDNFTYPRYSLDFSLFRAVDASGRPLSVDEFFPFEAEGTDAGELVFVIGNPGSTTRMQTVSQLEYRRDFTEPAFAELLAEGERVYGDYVHANPDAPGTPELMDLWFSLGNSRKVYVGRVAGLRDPYVIARRRAAERDFTDALAARSELTGPYGDVVQGITANRSAAASLGPAYGAFVGLVPGSPLTATAMGRGILAAQYLDADAEARAGLREQLVGMSDQPAAIQQGLIAARIARMQRYLGASDPTVRALLDGRSASAATAAIAGSGLATAAGTQALLDGSEAALAADPAVVAARAFLPAMMEFQQANAASNAEIAALSTRLARARFELYGTSIPPDATFTLRISDGVVRGYPYNGTEAPPYTTFYGMYDRHYAHPASVDWALPDRFLPIPDDLDLGTPLNFVSTADTYGGNSGSPAITKDLELVGLNFDRNVEGLSRDFIYLPERGRNVMVDSRAILEALDDIYDADRIVAELLTGRLDVPAAEAERIRP